MAQNSKSEVVQAMPIEVSTFIGTATDIKPMGGTILLTEDADITFSFVVSGNTITKIVSGLAGDNFQAGYGCTGITSSAGIILT